MQCQPRIFIKNHITGHSYPLSLVSLTLSVTEHASGASGAERQNSRSLLRRTSAKPLEGYTF